MSEMQNLIHMNPITSLNVIQYPSGRYGYAGKVPCSIGYVDATPEKIALAKSFGERFGPKIRSFATKEEAFNFAKNAGYKVQDES